MKIKKDGTPLSSKEELDFIGGYLQKRAFERAIKHCPLKQKFINCLKRFRKSNRTCKKCKREGER